MKKVLALIASITLTSTAIMAQEEAPVAEAPAAAPTTTAAPATSADEGYNPLSAKRIHSSDIMWRKTVLRALDLREKQNKPIFSNGKEITKIIIEAVKAGILTPYASDSLTAKLPMEKFLKNIQLPSAEPVLTEEEKAFKDSEKDEWGGDGEAPAETASKGGSEFFPKDLYQMQIKEDMIFDKQRSRMYYDILAITLFVPADHPDNIKGIEIPIASFSYKELAEKVFVNNPNAVWYNPQNDSEHRNLADAFEIRLFSSYIIKVSNPEDQYLVDIYGGDPKTGILQYTRSDGVTMDVRNTPCLV